MLNKLQALMATAYAFYQRGSFIQYDQLNMDRLVRITPRRNKYAAPEDATEQHTLFLDCSSFIFAVYYNALGYELEDDITWRMMDRVKPCVFRFEPTHKETPEEQKSIANEITDLLQPGDCLVVQFESNGHIMLYGGDGIFFHCTAKDGASSYNYTECKENFSPHGAIYIDKLKDLLNPDESGTVSKYYIFGDRIKRFCVLRPLENAEKLTANASARVGEAQDLKCSVLTSNPGGRTAMPGDTVTFKLFVENLGKSAKRVNAEFIPPEGAELLSADTTDFGLEPHSKKEICFKVRIKDSCAAYIDPPGVSVNGLAVSAPRVLLCRSCDKDIGLKAASIAKELFDAGEDIMTAASRAYASLGIALPDSISSVLKGLFIQHDSIAGDVLWRTAQKPSEDMALYSFFGGTGVVTPEAALYPFCRTKKILARDLFPGDIILTGDDGNLAAAKLSVYTGHSFIGANKLSSEYGIKDTARAEAFCESLLGRFCFVVLRPMLKRF